MSATATATTADTIRAAALELADVERYPEAAEAIAAGEPVILCRASTRGSGWNVELWAVLAVVIPEALGGGNAHASTPQYTSWRRRRGTERATDMATRFARRSFGADLPVVVID